MASSQSPSTSRWQDQLQEECRKRNVAIPQYMEYSDRRGGRTAWSCSVTVDGQQFPARYWYDGQYVNNAKEDCAEVALQTLGQQQTGVEQAQQWQQQQAQAGQQQPGGSRGWN